METPGARAGYRAGARPICYDWPLRFWEFCRDWQRAVRSNIAMTQAETAWRRRVFCHYTGCCALGIDRPPFWRTARHEQRSLKRAGCLIKVQEIFFLLLSSPPSPGWEWPEVRSLSRVAFAVPSGFPGWSSIGFVCASGKRQVFLARSP